MCPNECNKCNTEHLLQSKNRRDNEYEEETLISYIFFQSLFDGNAYNKSPIYAGKTKGMTNTKLRIIEVEIRVPQTM